ncbi:MAG: bifunctional proline dehydrogenase/L-glutamate gamma-semialdehyde dehydrogenase PutA [Proteobacteria bacterium]|nr:bifunctional proline dehydrogenase/L-glutamate gamma-semialdehyde dehydrogenase PutA [Pseudomonadota bacterium]
MTGVDIMASKIAPYLYADEAQCVDELLAALPWDAARAQRVDKVARDFVARVRAAKRKTGELESFLQQYGLDTEEGLALMTLAEALLRIPDAHTADLLIRDKMKAAEWLSRQGGSKDMLVKAAGFGLSLASRALDSAVGRLGEPVIRKAMVEAMRMMGRQFVLGRTIDEAVKNAKDYEKKGYRMSYDMLGEGARTAADAERYFNVYSDALTKISGVAEEKARPGMSVKLSALHPRYEFRHADRCVPELTERLRVLARQAANANIALTVDAEEADRLETSLKIIKSVAADKSLNGWEGFGLAVQAYSKRCSALIDYLAAFAQEHKRKLQVRLVKGAYWDTEVKRAQILGLKGYPVFTRKANTDVSYIACARKMLERRDVFYPMFATHNAHSVAAVMELAGNNRNGFEFQRLHGMGETLHDLVLADGAAPVSVYAPCGSHEDLLPYLVRRLLENGANSSFVNKLLDPKTLLDEIVADPVADARAHKEKRHPKIPLPKDIYGVVRLNSSGIDITEITDVAPLLSEMRKVKDRQWEAAPLIGGKPIREGAARPAVSPADNAKTIGTVWETNEAQIEKAFAVAQRGFREWDATPAEDRAAALERFGDLMEQHRAELMGLIALEGGRTIEDGLSEVREAVDFCRYYAMRGRMEFAAAGEILPGPTGERNILTQRGRGVLVCVSPWNFPLAIFAGQITAALMAGNAVIAKPASPTPLIAMRAVELMIEAGVHPEAITLLPGGGRLGGVMIAHPDVAGVAFTGSTEVAWGINRALAAKNRPIVPLIAETGGQNAMIADSSALSEQIVDDVIVSAFRSAGQRCSALRVLHLQEDMADKVIDMLKGAMAQQRPGDPMDLSTDIGPVIDMPSRAVLEKHRAWLDGNGAFIAAAPMDEKLYKQGSFFAPCAYEIGNIRALEKENFGPVLHIVRYKAKELESVIADINATGFGLTFGVHTRITSVMRHVTGAVRAGNAYVNRSMIGAVVGVQPFGGQGLSGTGPKAGGPHYLPRFATERVTSTDTTRQGGNATLVSLKEQG